MKNTFYYFLRLQASLMLLLSFGGCLKMPSGEGTISISLYSSLTKTGSGIPSEGDFILRVRNSRGEYLYNGRFADSPESMEVPAGTYEVSAVSCDFSAPGYDSPQYGDSRVVTVTSGGTVAVALYCSMLNCGVLLDVDESFCTLFPSGTLYLKSSDGTLMHSYSESRTAYFMPGTLSVLLDDGTSSQTLLMRELPARQILSIRLSANSSVTQTGVSIQVDTSVTRVCEDYVYGNGGNSIEDAFSISQARDRIGQSGVWVWGYIVGSFSSSTKMQTEAPFAKNTNIVIASRTVVTDKSNCLSVELKTGDLRSDVNLMDNPGNLGGKIYLKGDIVQSYYSIPGLKNVTEYFLE